MRRRHELLLSATVENALCNHDNTEPRAKSDCDFVLQEAGFRRSRCHGRRRRWNEGQIDGLGKGPSLSHRCGESKVCELGTNRTPIHARTETCRTRRGRHVRRGDTPPRLLIPRGLIRPTPVRCHTKSVNLIYALPFSEHWVQCRTFCRAEREHHPGT